ncbi:MAG: hypothetical protein PHE54_03675 [Bacilli bacterium]|nr:hypothetical protein [Bacilli bacterium]
MKKLLGSLALMGLVLVTGCTAVTGDYKEGTYFGSSSVYESYGRSYVSTAVVYVDESGKIASVFIDATYVSDNVNTTKKVLGDDYGMKSSSEAGYEWYEEINLLEDKIVEEQGLDWITWSDTDETETDSVAGVTIAIDSYYEAVSNALNQAK